ncbi:MAG: Flp pilus assembly complex ATPase component [bacterium]|nr:Flp pilus assembly complex ATPase component [bacterium]
MVFTTLHTNSAIESISRLLSMGVKSYILAPALNMIIAQRLVRKVCECAVKRDASYAEKAEIEASVKKINEANPKMQLKFDGKVTEAVGCEKCNHT